jgi:hypothetical protein
MKRHKGILKSQEETACIFIHHNGSQIWKDAMKDFVENTIPYLEQYHKKSNTESGFAADKKMLGWKIAHRRDDMIDSALFCTESGTICSIWAGIRIVSPHSFIPNDLNNPIYKRQEDSTQNICNSNSYIDYVHDKLLSINAQHVIFT